MPARGAGRAAARCCPAMQPDTQALVLLDAALQAVLDLLELLLQRRYLAGELLHFLLAIMAQGGKLLLVLCPLRIQARIKSEFS